MTNYHNNNIRLALKEFLDSEQKPEYVRIFCSKWRNFMGKMNKLFRITWHCFHIVPGENWKWLGGPDPCPYQGRFPLFVCPTNYGENEVTSCRLIYSHHWWSATDSNEIFKYFPAFALSFWVLWILVFIICPGTTCLKQVNAKQG